MFSYTVPPMPQPGTKCRWFACSKAATAVMVSPADGLMDPLCPTHAARLAKSEVPVFHKAEPLELCRFTGAIPDAIQVLRSLS